MFAYILVAIWLFSHIVCLYLVKQRNLRPGIVLKVIGVILGPLAIPLVYILKGKA